MSVELMVLSDRRLSSMSDWQRAIDTEGLHLALPADISIEMLSGFLPVRSNDTGTGFECDYFDVQEILADYPDVNFGRSWRCCLVVRWNGDGDACLAASIAAAAYAKASEGIVFDPQDGVVMSAQEALAQIPDIRRELEKWRGFGRVIAERIGRGS